MRILRKGIKVVAKVWCVWLVCSRKEEEKMKKIFEKLGDSGMIILVIIALGALALFMIGTDNTSIVGQAFSQLIQKLVSWAA